MGGGVMAAKLCDSCKSATATVFCRPDSAYLCMSCDSKVHAANKLASRHPRVWVCEVCEQAPASVTCKADAAHLCTTCDRDIHSANPLARRHDRVPLSPFFDSSAAAATAAAASADPPNNAAARSAAICKLFGDDYYSDADEAEAASWLLPNPNPNKSDDLKSIDFLFTAAAAGAPAHDIDPYLDLDFGSDPKPDPSADGVVPDPDHKGHHHSSLYSLSGSDNHFDGFHNHQGACKPYSLPSYNTAAQPCLSHTVSSSSLDFGVVPEGAMGDVASTGVEKQQQMKMVGLDREARVLRYREKRKNRRFEKTIRYASRKAYAETRPRIKGRFAKRSDVEADLSTAAVDGLFASDPGYGVVPTY